MHLIAGARTLDEPKQFDPPSKHLRWVYGLAKDRGMKEMIAWRAERFGNWYLTTWRALLDDDSIEPVETISDKDLFLYYKACPRLRQFFRKDIENRNFINLRRARHVLEFCTDPGILRSFFPDVREEYCAERALKNQNLIENSIITIRIFCGASLIGVDPRICETSFRFAHEIFRFATVQDPTKISDQHFSEMIAGKISVF